LPVPSTSSSSASIPSTRKDHPAAANSSFQSQVGTGTPPERKEAAPAPNPLPREPNPKIQRLEKRLLRPKRTSAISLHRLCFATYDLIRECFLPQRDRGCPTLARFSLGWGCCYGMWEREQKLIYSFCFFRSASSRANLWQKIVFANCQLLIAKTRQGVPRPSVVFARAGSLLCL
jgi:hypothetical protein